MPNPYWNRIDGYWYFWFSVRAGGRVFLKVEDGTTLHFDVDDDVRFQGIIESLLAQDDSMYNMHYKSIGTGSWQPPGEGIPGAD